MNRLITKKPASDQKLTFLKMGVKPDKENAADAKKPGDAKEDAADSKKKLVKKKVNPFAKKAAAAIVGKG